MCKFTAARTKVANVYSLKYFVVKYLTQRKANLTVFLAVNLRCMSENLTIRPHKGFQEKFAASNVDITFGVGALGSGKSYGLLLAMAEPLMTDPNFRGLISRRARESMRVGGGFIDKFKEIFGEYTQVKVSDNPRASFSCGAYCDMTYVDSSDMKKLTERVKGWEYDCICFDEITELSWEAFSYIMTRNRGASRTFTGKIFATLNPKRSHWTRKFLDWYIGIDGYVKKEREGCVRYFFVNGDTVDDVVWGDSKEEVYRNCQVSIDRKMEAVGGNISYENLIKSFVFYQGKMSENTSLVERNADYVGSAVAVGGKMAQSLVEANFNVDPVDDYDIPIPSQKAQACFTNDPCRNGDRWITVDLADYGKDNLVALVFDGGHCYDILIANHTTPKDNASRIKALAAEHGIPESHIIYDGTNGRYFNDYLPDAIPFMSIHVPIGMYAPSAMNLKDECALRLVKMIDRGEFTFDDRVARQIYTHQKLKFPITVQQEFIEECSVVRFKELPSGKKRLLSKKEMNMHLGKGRSMDLFDPCNMYMYHFAELEYGQEIQFGLHNAEMEAQEYEEHGGGQKQSIYDETLWQ